ncbi:MULTISPECIES: hypothetical protein [Sphingobacterium]|uniref:hypothetical protein n=1 Tax=Sphingobacterium TaxID=28453 RepID=UPI0013DA9534|nr:MULTISPECIES: hypothetical protein [unclassified Sphingobacterium]
MKVKKFFILLSPLIVILIISIILNNRSLILGIIVSIIYIMHLLTKRKYILWIPFIALFFLFFIKLDSSLGRILIYRISLPILKDNWLTGIGVGNTKYVYPFYQEHYFKLGKNSQQDILLADNTYYLFNEYYTIILELGVFIVPFILIFFMIINRQIKILINSEPSILTVILTSILITFLIYSAFNFTISAYPILLVPLTSLISLLFSSYLRKNLFFIILLMFISIVPYLFYRFEKMSINNIYEYYRAGIDLNYQELLKEEPYFYQSKRQYLNLKSEIFYKNEKWEDARVATIQLIHQYPCDLYIVRLGLIFENMGNIKEAENFLIRSTYFVPRRLTSRYELFKFYIRNNQVEKAKRIAYEIKNKKIKISSEITNFIIFEVTNYINTHEIN